MPAVIFDMDGVLIDSEPLWKETELEVFGGLGVPLTLAMTNETTGLGIGPVARLWHSRYPWAGESPESVAKRIQDRVAERVTARGQPVPGAIELVHELRGAGVRVALCTSSAPLLIGAVLDRLGLSAAFEVRQSSEGLARGKPAPDPYLAAARALALPTEACLTIEDSLNGMRSARAAGCRVVGLSAAPEAPALCHLVIRSFAELGVPRLLALLPR